jgi:type I restriction enzyme M protein
LHFHTEGQLPRASGWDDITAREGIEQLNFYRATLLHLGTEASGRVQAIFVNSRTSIKQAKNLSTLVTEIEARRAPRRFFPACVRQERDRAHEPY